MTARHRDLEFLEGEVALEPSQEGSAGSSDVTGAQLTLQDYNSPQSAKFVCMLASSDSSDDFEFMLEESTDGGSSWTENSNYSVSGLSNNTNLGIIEVDNLQDLAADIRVKINSTNTTQSSTNNEVAAAVIFGGKKTV